MTEAGSPFAGATGHGVRVGVIDSGVNPRHPHIISVAGGFSIVSGGSSDANSYIDVLGHGTAVMAAIQEKAPAAQYFAVKLFHSTLSTSAAFLFEAIRWCIDHEMAVINLSLGTSNPQPAPVLSKLVQEAVEKGIVLVSAFETDGKAYFPGSLPGVIGVGLDWNCDRDSYRVEPTSEKAVFYASGYPRPAPGVPPQRNLHGISFAVANMTGFVVRARELSPSASAEIIHGVLVNEVGTSRYSG